VRAEPIAALYEKGKVSHAGTFPELEDQLANMTSAGYVGEGSAARCLELITDKLPTTRRWGAALLIVRLQLLR